MFKSWTLAALPMTLIGSLGSIYLSVGMGLKACPLCFYQHLFIFSVAAVLGVGLAAACLVSLPPAPPAPHDQLLDVCRPPFQEVIS